MQLLNLFGQIPSARACVKQRLAKFHRIFLLHIIMFEYIQRYFANL